MRTKYRLVAPEVVKKFEKAYFGEYTSLGFSNLERVEPAREKVTILRRKSLDKIFVEDNFKLLERDVSEFASSVASRQPHSAPAEDKVVGTAEAERRAAAVDSKVRPDYLLSRESVSAALPSEDPVRKKFAGFKNGRPASEALK